MSEEIELYTCEVCGEDFPQDEITRRDVLEYICYDCDAEAEEIKNTEDDDKNWFRNRDSSCFSGGASW